MDIPAVGPILNDEDLSVNNSNNNHDPNTLVDDVENRPPNPPLDVISASSNEPHLLIDHEDPDPLTSMEVDIGALEESNDIISQHLPSRGFVPGPLREEPTLKEKLVDRERQRRKEAERARLKRQFALMSNGGGLVYDSVGAIGGASITGTVGEESTHADMEDSGLVHSHSHHHQGGDTSPQQLGYTMERFLQETATSSAAAAANNIILSRSGGAFAVASAIASSTDPSNVIREEAIEGDPAIARAPDKGVVMERFLNDPVVVDAAPPTPNPSNMRENPQASGRTEDVHRSVSFDMELRTNPNNGNRRHTDDVNDPNDAIDDHLHLSMDDSNASVQVEVAPEDDMMEPVSPGGRLSVPSEVAPSSIDTDEHHHRRQNSEMETSLGSVGPSIDRQSLSSNVNNGNDDDDDTDDEPRVLRLTEAEIQEMAAIEEASIGNAPPSDRDAESLVGDLVGTFGTPNVGEGGMNFGQDQDTTTTAMESGSILSGHPLSAPRSTAMQGDQPPSMRGEDMDDMDHNSIDDMASSASVSSHLFVSPGASVSGSAVSVTANPPSEIIGRGDTTTILEGDDDRNTPVPPPPSSVVVDSAADMQALTSPPGSVVDADEDRNSDRDLAGQASNDMAEFTGSSARREPSPGMVITESRSSMAIREELRASDGPPAEEIVNRRLRPGMVETAAAVPHQSSNSHVASRPESRVNIVDTPRSVRTVEEFDFDKNDVPMTPRSLMSDSLRDLPGDDHIWGSPGSKMNVSPLLHRGISAEDKYTRRAVDPVLSVPNMSHEEASSDSLPSMLETAFREVRINNSSTVEAKEAELYCRGSTQAKALETRLLPLVITLLIEIPVLNMMSQDSRISSVIGQQHYQLLLGFTPLIAAISGNASAQASSLTTTAICNGMVTPSSYWKWVQEECKVTAIVGLGMGAAVGVLAITLTSGTAGENLAFATAVSIAQCVSLTSAGCIASISPLLMTSLFRRNSRIMNGLVARATVDVIAVSLTSAITYCILTLLISQVDPADATTGTV